MRGKIAEKRGDDILDALKLYLTALGSLKDQGYYIPKRIQYNTPPDAALEMLEIYYRINASILKLEINDKLDTMSKEDVSSLAEVLEKVKTMDIFTRGKTKFKQKLHDTPKSNKNDDATNATTKSEDQSEARANNSEDSDPNKDKDEEDSKAKVAADSSSQDDSQSQASSEKEETTASKQQSGDDRDAVKKEEEVVTEEPKDDKDTVIKEIVRTCLAAMELCVGTFSNHFKSLSLLGTYYLKIGNVTKARAYLLSAPGRTPYSPVFSEKKANNFCNGIWRNPVVEFDRPGNFYSHVGKAMTNLFKVSSIT